MELEKGQLGAVGTQSVEFTGGALIVKIDAGYGAASADMTVKIDGKALFDAIVGKVPSGPVQDVLKALEGAILGVSAPAQA